MFSIGAGYSGQDGAMLMAQISQQNLFGRGQSLTLQGALGTVNNTVNISFTEPYLFDLPLWMKTDLWTLTHAYDTYNLASQGAAITFGYPIWEKIVGYIGYRYSVNDVKDVSILAGQSIKDQAGVTATSGILLALSRDTTDDSMFPTTGSRHRADINLSGGFLGGDNSFGKYNYGRVVVLQGPALRRRPRLLASVAYRIHPGLRG